MNINTLTWAAATLLLSLIVHISMVLAIPYLSENDAWRRMLNFTQANEMLVIKDLKEGNQLWAFHAPDIKYAICRYDITRAPVLVNFKILRGYWSVAIYDDEGRNFYAADGFDLLRPEMSLMLLGSDDVKKNENALPIMVPTDQGIVVIRAPLDNQVLKSQVFDTLNQAKCEQLKAAQRIKH